MGTLNTTIPRPWDRRWRPRRHRMTRHLWYTWNRKVRCHSLYSHSAEELKAGRLPPCYLGWAGGWLCRPRGLIKLNLRAIYHLSVRIHQSIKRVYRIIDTGNSIDVSLPDGSLPMVYFVWFIVLFFNGFCIYFFHFGIY